MKGKVEFPPETITRAELAQIVYRYIKLESAPTQECKFTDVKGHWAESIIAKVHAAGMMDGYSNDTFQPDQVITHAESVDVIHRMLSKPAWR